MRLDRNTSGGVVCAAVIAAYGVLAFSIFSPNAMYTVDVGVKYAQAQALVDQHFLSLNIPYRGESIDPHRFFVPFRAPYVIWADGHPQAIWSSSTALFNGVFVALGGYHGMIAASLIGAAISLVLAWRLTPGAAAGTVPLVLGFGTPLWFFGTIGWEHAPAVALATLAWFQATRATNRSQALIAGLLLGCGGALRGEVLLLGPGLAAVLWARRRAVHPIVLAAAGAAGVILIASAVEVWWFDRPPAAHTFYTSGLARSLMGQAEHTLAGVEALTPYTWHERYTTVIHYWLLGYSDNVAITLAAGALVAAVLAYRVRRITWPFVTLLATLAAFAAWDVWTLLNAPKWLAGLYRMSPFLLFAFVPLPKGEPTRSTTLRASTLVAVAGYLALAFTATDLAGGKGLPRILLPLVPLMAISAWQAITAYARSEISGERWIGRLGFTLAVLACAMHVGGAIPAYAARSRQDGRLVDYLQQAHDPVIVVDDADVAQRLLPLYFDKQLLLADTPELRMAVASSIESAGIEGFLLVSHHPELMPIGSYGHEHAQVFSEPIPVFRFEFPRARASSLSPETFVLVMDLIEAFDASERRPAGQTFSVGPVTIAGRSKTSISVDQPEATRITWEITIPEQARLEVSAGMREEAWNVPGDGAFFLIGVSDGEDYRQLSSTLLNPSGNPGDRAWRDIVVDLSAYAGKTVGVIFNTRSSVPGRSHRSGDFLSWGEPRIMALP